MSEFSDMLERVKIDEVIAFLMYGTDSIIEHSGTYEERIKNAYDDIFNKLEKMFPSANRNDDELHGAVLDFSIVHNEVYLEMGVIIGFQMYKNMEQGYMDFEVNGMDKIIKQNLSEEKKPEEKSNDKESVLQGLFDEGICNSLEAALRIDKGYKDARKIANETLDDIDNLELDKKQWSTVDRAVSAANALGAAYGRAAYAQGFKDSVKLISELQNLLSVK